MTERRGASPALGGLLALLGLLLVVFSDLVLGGRILFERDLHQMYWAQARSFADVSARGGWPLWDPLRGFGEPMLANPSAQALYPWTWLHVFFRPERLYTFFVLSHLLLGGAGAIVLARRLALSWPAAIVTGLVWTASGPVLSLVTLWHHLAGATWMPWVVAAADAALERPDRRRTVAWAAVLTLQILAGSADVCVMTAVITLAVSFRHVWLAPSGRARLRSTLAAAGAAGLALALAAPMWWPAIALVRVSDRAALPESTRAFWSVHPATMVQTLLPVFPDQLPIRTELRALLYGSHEPFLGSLYLGAAALPLVALAFLGSRRRLTLTLALVGLFAALLALGRFGVLYDLALAVAPPLRSFRYPEKAMVVVAFVWAVLAGLGTDAATVGPRRRILAVAAAMAALVSAAAVVGTWLPDGIAAWAFGGEATPPLAAAASTVLSSSLWRTAGIALVATLCWLAWARGRRPAAFVLGVASLAVLDLAATHRSLNPTAPAPLFEEPPPVVEALRLYRAERVFAFDYSYRILGKAYRRTDPLLPRSASDSPLPFELRFALAHQAFLSPPIAPRFDLRGSFERDWLGLKPRPLRSLTLVARAAEELPEFTRLLQAAGVTHVVALHEEGLEELRELAAFDDPHAGTVRLFAVPDPSPRAYAVGAAREAEGLPALRLLSDPGFDPRREVVLPPAAGGLDQPFPGPGPVRITEDSGDRVRLEADLPHPGYVVLLDAFDPGWRARVDGAPTPVLRANVGFRAVRAPAGRHVIELVYRPDGLAFGLALAAIAVVAVMVAAAIRGGRGRPLTS